MILRGQRLKHGALYFQDKFSIDHLSWPLNPVFRSTGPQRPLWTGYGVTEISAVCGSNPNTGETLQREPFNFSSEKSCFPSLNLSGSGKPRRVNHSGGWPHQPDFRRSSGPSFSVGTQQRGNAYSGLLGRHAKRCGKGDFSPRNGSLSLFISVFFFRYGINHFIYDNRTCSASSTQNSCIQYFSCG
jgi:hypothetical protein